jgi:hypothetical protein
MSKPGNESRIYIALLVLYVFVSPPLHASRTIENASLKLTLDESGNMMFYDLNNNVSWSSSFPGWVTLTNQKISEKIPLTSSNFSAKIYSDCICFTFSGLNGDKITDDKFQIKGKFTVSNQTIEFEITSLNTQYLLEELEYPAHLLTVASGNEEGYIAVPHLQGILIPSRYDAGFMRYGQNIWEMISDQEEWWNFESGNLNMPWFGASKNGSSVLVTLHTASDAALHLIGNKVVDKKGSAFINRSGELEGTRISSLSPIWKSSKKELSYSRKMRIELVDHGYVGMAFRYKEYAKEAGRYVTLKQKIAQNPEIEKIIGAPDIKIYCFTNRINNPYFKAWSEPVLNGYSKVNTTFQQVGEMADELKAMGVDKCMFLLGGWNRMGYDREHVDMWPPAEAAGGIKGLAKACKTVKKNGYLFALHDNYDDFYPDAPSFDEKYILRDHDGSLHKGGVWDGGLCYITCPSLREELLNRNMALIQGSISLNAYYFDVITNTSHYECYDERHPLTRQEDLKYRLALLDNIAERGMVIGGERGTDWAMPVVGFCEGLSGGGTGYHRGLTYRSGLTVPLFYLVYRECVVGYWQHGTPHGREDHANHVLLDLLYGQPSSWSIEYAQWSDLKPMIKETYDLLGRFHEKTAHLAMVDHQYLTEDYMVQRTKLNDGTEVWVNFGFTTYEKESFTLPPKGFLIFEAGGKVTMGKVSRSIEYTGQTKQQPGIVPPL